MGIWVLFDELICQIEIFGMSEDFLGFYQDACRIDFLGSLSLIVL